MATDENELEDNQGEEMDEDGGGNGKGCADPTKCSNPKDAKRKRAFAKRMGKPKGKSKKPVNKPSMENMNVRTLGNSYTTGESQGNQAGNIPDRRTRRLWSR